MASRTETIPEDLLNHLAASIPGFALESDAHQFALARMVWLGDTKRKAHLHFEGAMSFTYQELAKAFGRDKFNAVNSRLSFFSLSENWSRDFGWTKGYWFSEQVRASINRYSERSIISETRLIMANGKVLRTLPAAVSSKDMAKATTKGWSSAAGLNSVEVNLEMLELLQKFLKQICQEWRSGVPPSDLFTFFPDQATTQRLLNATSQIIQLAKIDVSGCGFVMQHYVQAISGRLYASGISLQTTPSLIKQAALAGMWEYDFSNCHYAILDQMAGSFGHECTAIRKYLADRITTRQCIAAQVGISVEDAKTCLLAVLYGARASEWHENAIPQAISAEAAARLYLVPAFRAIKADISTARKIILKKFPRTANGSLTNACGNAISGKATSAKKLAHLLQGIEAKALQSALELYPNLIVLVQHDGFAAKAKLDISAIVSAVFKATGYKLELKEKRIQVDVDAYFLKRFAATQSKMKTLAKPMPMRVCAVSL